MWDAGEALRLQLVQGCACGGGLLTPCSVLAPVAGAVEKQQDCKVG